MTDVDRERAPSFNPIPGDIRLRSCGLYAGRSVLGDEFSGAVDEVDQAFEQFTPRDHFHINELNKPEVFRQQPIGTVTLHAAQARISNHVSSIHHSSSARIERVSLVPIRKDNSTLVVASLDKSSQQTVLRERGKLISALESFAPGARFIWQRFKNPGVPVGNIQPGTSPEDQEEIKRKIIRGLPRSFVFAHTELLPRIK